MARIDKDLKQYPWSILFWMITMGFVYTMLGWIFSEGQWWGALGGLGASLIVGFWITKEYKS